MLPQLPASVRVFVCTRATDMRKSFDGLQGLVHEFLGQDPVSGHLFLFFNRRRDRAKILFWDRDGMVIWYKKHGQDYPHPFPCTETGRCPHNLIGRPATAGGMD
jgi:transposase